MLSWLTFFWSLFVAVLVNYLHSKYISDFYLNQNLESVAFTVQDPPPRPAIFPRGHPLNSFYCRPCKSL